MKLTDSVVNPRQNTEVKRVRFYTFIMVLLMAIDQFESDYRDTISALRDELQSLALVSRQLQVRLDKAGELIHSLNEVTNAYIQDARAAEPNCGESSQVENPDADP